MTPSRIAPGAYTGRDADAAMAYGVLGVAVLVLAYLVAAGIQRLADRLAVARVAAAGTGPDGRADGPGRRFVVGTLPARHDTWLLAYVCGGVAGVADVLLARARADGSLVPEPGHPGWYRVRRGAAGASLPAPLEEFFAEFGDADRSAADARAAACAVALRAEPAMRAELAAWGFVRSSRAAWWTRGARLAGGVVAVGAGLVLAATTVAGVEPRAWVRGLLVLETAGLGYLAALLVRMPLDLHGGLTRYLGWLASSHRDVVQEVRAGGGDLEDLALAVALAGASALPPRLADPALWPPN